MCGTLTINTKLCGMASALLCDMNDCISEKPFFIFFILVLEHLKDITESSLDAQ